MIFSIHPAQKIPRSDATIHFIPEFDKVAPVKELHGISLQEFKGALNSTILLRASGHKHLYVGLGEMSTIKPEQFRKAAGTAARLLRKTAAQRVTIDMSSYVGYIPCVVEGITIGLYEFKDFKEKKLGEPEIDEIQIVVPKTTVEKARRQMKTGQISEAVNLARAIGNQPGNVMYPEALAERAMGIAKEYKLKATIFDQTGLVKNGFDGIIAVGKGSAREPRLIVLEYQGASSKSDKPLALVGKAITFDSGGISIKPSDKMEEMKFDKMGGVAVLAAIQAIAALNLPINVVALIACAENMPGPDAYRPGDIVSTYDKKTIEVLSTDAEGRIVLADALAYARIKYKPAAMIDLATLTGACIVALGEYKAGLFSNNDDFLKDVKDAADLTGEAVWHMPLGPEYQEQIKSDVALVKNLGGRYGGAITAAAFLENWAEKIPWAHLDIAGVAWTTREFPYLAKGATGFGVRLLVQLASQIAENQE